MDLSWNLPVNYTLAQARSATKAQIVTAITNVLNTYSKRQILIWLLNNAVSVSDDTLRTYAPDGQIASQTDVDRDVETGAMVGGRVVTYSYYDTGEVKDIVISTRDAANKEVARKTIHHFTDGKQPTVS